MINDNTTKWKVRKFTDFASNQAMPVGFEYFSMNPNIPIGRLPLFGGEYDRIIYADLWSWVQEQAGYLITEEEWQTYATNNDGNVPFYSSGDGSTTFRVPKLPNTIVTDASDGEVPVVGNGKALGLTGSGDTVDTFMGIGTSNQTLLIGRALAGTTNAGDGFTGNGVKSNVLIGITTDATKSGIVAEVSSAKTNGQWLVVAFGTVTNVGNLDMANVASGVENIQTRLNEHEHLLQENENALTIVGYHNSIYRGKYLGDKLTSAQSATIRAGEFEDLYIGDYWTIGGVNYRIAAFDYYYNCGDTACTTHHVVVVPDTVLYNAQMNSSNVVTGGYVGSAMYTTNLNSAKTTIANAFGTDHLLTIRQLFTNTASGNIATNFAWTDATVWLMNEINVYGTYAIINVNSSEGWNAGKYSIDNTQYPLFAMNPRMIHTRQTYWLRDVATSTSFALVGTGGVCNHDYSSGSHGVRPAFLVY